MSWLETRSHFSPSLSHYSTFYIHWVCLTLLIPFLSFWLSPVFPAVCYGVFTPLQMSHIMHYTTELICTQYLVVVCITIISFHVCINCLLHCDEGYNQYMYKHTYIGTYMCLLTYVCIHACRYICIYICICTNTHVHTTQEYCTILCQYKQCVEQDLKTQPSKHILQVLTTSLNNKYHAVKATIFITEIIFAFITCYMCQPIAVIIISFYFIFP